MTLIQPVATAPAPTEPSTNWLLCGGNGYCPKPN